MTQANRISQLLMRSPLVWGALVTLGFYSLLDSGQFPSLGLGGPIEEYFRRYFAGHWVEYVEGGLFFLGLAALALKLFDLCGQFAAFKQPLLPAAEHGSQTSADCERLLARLDELPERLRESLLAQRLREALQHVRRQGSADKLDEELKYLSDMGAGNAHASYALVRIIIWAIPIMGFLGTVIGITMAIANISPQQLEESLPQVTAGLGVAFDTTAVALTQSIFLMFGQFLCDKIETRLLAKVDAHTIEELAGRFEQIGGSGDPQVAAVRRMVDAVLHNTERTVERQAQLWQASLEAAQQRWSQTATAAGEQIQTALASSLSQSLQAHARQLAEAERAAAQQSQQHWSGVEQALVRCAEAATAQQHELTRQGEILRQVVEATGQVTRLEETLNRNLAALAGSQNFEETVQSLAAVIHLLNARLGQAPAAAPNLSRSQSRNVDKAA